MYEIQDYMSNRSATTMNNTHMGVRMKSRIIVEDVKVESIKLTLALPQFKHVANFEFAKLGCFFGAMVFYT